MLCHGFRKPFSSTPESNQEIADAISDA